MCRGADVPRPTVGDTRLSPGVASARWYGCELSRTVAEPHASARFGGAYGALCAGNERSGACLAFSFTSEAMTRVSASMSWASISPMRRPPTTRRCALPKTSRVCSQPGARIRGIMPFRSRMPQASWLFTCPSPRFLTADLGLTCKQMRAGGVLAAPRSSESEIPSLTSFRTTVGRSPTPVRPRAAAGRHGRRPAPLGARRARHRGSDVRAERRRRAGAPPRPDRSAALAAFPATTRIGATGAAAPWEPMR